MDLLKRSTLICFLFVNLPIILYSCAPTVKLSKIPFDVRNNTKSVVISSDVLFLTNHFSHPSDGAGNNYNNVSLVTGIILAATADNREKTENNIQKSFNSKVKRILSLTILDEFRNNLNRSGIFEIKMEDSLSNADACFQLLIKWYGLEGGGLTYPYKPNAVVGAILYGNPPFEWIRDSTGHKTLRNPGMHQVLWESQWINLTSNEQDLVPNGAEEKEFLMNPSLLESSFSKTGQIISRKLVDEILLK